MRLSKPATAPSACGATQRRVIHPCSTPVKPLCEKPILGGALTDQSSGRWRWYRNTDNFHRWHDLTSCQVSDWPKNSLGFFHKHSREEPHELLYQLHQQMRYKDNLMEPYDHLLRKHSICPLLQMGKVRLRGKGGSGLKPYREEMTEPRWNPGF